MSDAVDFFQSHIGPALSKSKSSLVRNADATLVCARFAAFVAIAMSQQSADANRSGPLDQELWVFKDCGG